MEDLANRYPRLKVENYEVWYDDANRELFSKMAKAFDFEPSGVPVTFIGERYWIGYNEEIGEEIKAYASACLETGCRDAGADVVPHEPAEPILVVEETPDVGANVPSIGEADLNNSPEHEQEDSNIVVEETHNDVINIPLIGKVNLSDQSLFFSTLIISFVDGFNPCSLWVLSILLAITLHTGSRKKILIIGLVFLTVTALVYALFIAGLFTLLSYISFLGWIQVAVALMALFFAVINIKDYFWYKEGLSFTIADEKKPGIYQNIRRVMNACDSLWALITATVAMSVGVSLVEFSCTAGFPVMWTNLLTAQKATPLTFVLLLLLYMFIYQIDEIAIFLTSVFTLKSSRIEEKHGRILKLIGGALMLTLALVMLIKPALMSNLESSLVIFAVAVGAAFLTLLIHRKVLPAFGIYIGSEELSPKEKRMRRRQQKRRA
ncbi:MAG: hypothetical protein JXA21_09205 [Anaerolineae bacterium]|nr:hypothetical protein [Anaerolineae bacterium]